MNRQICKKCIIVLQCLAWNIRKKLFYLTVCEVAKPTLPFLFSYHFKPMATAMGSVGIAEASPNTGVVGGLTVKAQARAPGWSLDKLDTTYARKPCLRQPRRVFG